jgi:SAM-dependent methyltransferase
MGMCWDAIVTLYERHARDFDRDRSRELPEKAWLDRFLSHVRPSGVVLDLGCGVAEPIARYVLEAGFGVVGVDSSRSMIEMCRMRFPDSEWIVADMRELRLERRFDGLLAWDSFFHLHMDEQRRMFPRFAAHALPGAPLMFTSGPSHGEAIGSYRGEPLYHGSLDPSEYERLLVGNGFAVLAHRANDPECGEHTVWLTKCGPDARTNSGHP